MTSGMEAGVSRLNTPGTYNFREVAPGVLKPGRLYRSDALHRLTRAGRRMLADLGVSQIIDLRSSLDRRVGGRDRLRGIGASYLAVPIDGAPPRRVDFTKLDLRDVYRAILTRHADALGRVVRTIAEAEGPVVVHCTAGKDRTGLVVALTLSALEVDFDVIVADYAATEANLSGEWSERMLRKARRFRVPMTPNVIEVISASPASALRDTFDWLDDEFGGAVAYLETAGVDASVRARLHRSLME